MCVLNNKKRKEKKKEKRQEEIYCIRVHGDPKEIGLNETDFC